MPRTNEEVRAIEPPQHWSWIGGNSSCLKMDDAIRLSGILGEAAESLQGWCRANRLSVIPYTMSVYDINNAFYMYAQYDIQDREVEGSERFRCHNGGTHWVGIDFYCSHGAVPQTIACNTCGSASVGRSRRHYYCRAHAPMICPRCEVETWDMPGNAEVCYDCENHRCGECNEFSDDDLIWDDHEERGVCYPCTDRLNATTMEQPDDELGMIPEDAFLFENRPNRPVRMCSVELETIGAGNLLAETLGSRELSEYSNITGYHEGSQASSNDRYGFCHVERDSSLGPGGGELILEKMDLTDAVEAANAREALTIVNDLRDNGLVINHRCGTHVHISALQFGITHTRNLATLANYLEDPLYRVASARYNSHRGLRYAGKIDKTAYTTNREFGVRFLQENGHGHALNVSGYWQAVRNGCRCGAAVVGEYETCVCNLNRCTFEFRHFNGTANWRKLHGYIAICQGLVGFSRIVEHALDPHELPPLEYNFNVPVAPELLESWDERLRWLLKNIWFSPEERESVYYLANNCEMQQLGEERLTNIFLEPYAPAYSLVEVPEVELQEPRLGSDMPQVTDSLAEAVARLRNEPPPPPSEWMDDDDYDDREF